MSVDHVYYLGIKNKDTNKIRLAGPYDKEGNVLPILSRGSISNLWTQLYCIEEKDLEEDAAKEFTWENYTGEEVLEDVRYIKYDYDVGLPLKTCYVYKDSLMEYKRNESQYYEDDMLSDSSMSEEEYAIFCNAYLQNKKTSKKIYLEWNDTEVKTIPTDYILYRWVDYDSASYEEWMISETVQNLCLAWKHNENEELVILGVKR